MNSQPYNIVGEEQRRWRAQLARWPWEKHVRGPGRALVPVTQPTLLSRVYFSSPFLLHCICLDLVPCAEKAMATHSSTLAWKIPWTEEPGRLQSMGSRRVRHDWETSLSLITWALRHSHHSHGILTSMLFFIVTQSVGPPNCLMYFD